MSKTIGVVILAAGKGTRMKTECPKALVSALGKPLIQYVLESVRHFCSEENLSCDISVVVGHKKEMIENWIANYPYNSNIKIAFQKEQKGTADALKSCFEDLPEFWSYDYTIVTCADTPLITKEEFISLFQSFKNDSTLVGVAASFNSSNPTGYGRIVRGREGFHIVEEKDATELERKISEVNSGFYILKTSHVRETLSKIDNKNKSGEFYLTDLFQDQFLVKAINFTNPDVFLGINTPEQLSKVNLILQNKILFRHMNSGVILLSPTSNYIEEDVSIAPGVTIYPGVVLMGNTKILENVTLEPYCIIKDTIIYSNATILAHSYLESAIVGSHASIGPMARLRPGSDIGEKSKVGNFVEIKKSKLAQGVKVSHLSYVGDAEIGEETNIGCGFITCNYDGVKKHKTEIGKHSFIGSDCQVVAPIKIGDNSFVAAGSTITKDIPTGAFSIGRSPQVIKEEMAKKFLKSKNS